MHLSLAQTTPSDSDTLAWLETTRNFSVTQAIDFGSRLIAAIAIFLIGRLVIRYVVKLTENGMTRARFDQILVGFAGNVVSAGLLVLVIMVSLSTLGINLTSLTAVLAAAGFAVGMALQGSLSNFAAGILLVTFKPFRVGDFVEVAGVSGKVEEIHLFSCAMKTFDNVKLVVPNSQITSNVISNYSVEPQRMISLTIGCSYSDDLKGVKSLLTELVANDERILDDPEPVVAVEELGASSVNFIVRPWVRNEDYWGVKRDLTERIKLAFDERGFSFPFPSRDVFVHEVSSQKS